MAIRLLLLGVFIFGFGFTSVVSIPDSCYLKQQLNYRCTPCKFLSFGQEVNFGGFRSFYCPNALQSNGKKKYCCYDLLRRPFCCDRTVYIATGLVWLVVFAAITCSIWIFSGFLMWFYHKLWTLCFN
ncbi:uncharacterized protein LOC135841778 [Planococcus citri]|uniref:uncharacterized protein LOC135841778 n=1 Tax=Planococcus citri TaxID=170843 RepID=UPI0031F78143